MAYALKHQNIWLDYVRFRCFSMAIRNKEITTKKIRYITITIFNKWNTSSKLGFIRLKIQQLHIISLVFVLQYIKTTKQIVTKSGASFLGLYCVNYSKLLLLVQYLISSSLTARQGPGELKNTWVHLCLFCIVAKNKNKVTLSSIWRGREHMYKLGTTGQNMCRLLISMSKSAGQTVTDKQMDVYTIPEIRQGQENNNDDNNNDMSKWHIIPWAM